MAVIDIVKCHDVGGVACVRPLSSDVSVSVTVSVSGLACVPGLAAAPCRTDLRSARVPRRCRSQDSDIVVGLAPAFRRSYHVAQPKLWKGSIDRNSSGFGHL